MDSKSDAEEEEEEEGELPDHDHGPPLSVDGADIWFL